MPDWANWTSALSGVPALWVRAECPLAVCEGRERDRGDRQLGLARGQYASVHLGVAYDMVIDTQDVPPEENARFIIQGMRRHWGEAV